MIRYTILGSNNVEAARAFYTPLMAALGASELFDTGRLYFYGQSMDQPMLCIGGPYDREAASVGNGVMVSLDAGSTEKVDAVYALALELGGTDEGAPGERMPSFYGAYVRDLDGNKLCFCKLG